MRWLRSEIWNDYIKKADAMPNVFRTCWWISEKNSRRVKRIKLIQRWLGVADASVRTLNVMFRFRQIKNKSIHAPALIYELPHTSSSQERHKKNNKRRTEQCSVVNYLVFHVILLFCHILIDNHARRSFLLRTTAELRSTSSPVGHWKTCQCGDARE